MALKITSIERGLPAPCQHYRVTIDDAGVTRSATVTLNDLRDRNEWAEHGPVAALVLLWARYKLEKGATVASLVNVVIA